MRLETKLRAVHQKKFRKANAKDTVATSPIERINESKTKNRKKNNNCQSKQDIFSNTIENEISFADLEVILEAKATNNKYNSRKSISTPEQIMIKVRGGQKKQTKKITIRT